MSNARTTGASSPRCILVVDDDDEIRELAGQILEDEGYCVRRAATLADAIALLQSETFSLVLTDTFSATADGALSSTAPLHAAAGATPILLFSAHHFELQAAQAAGFSGIVPKPFEIDQMANAVRALLGDARTAG